MRLLRERLLRSDARVLLRDRRDAVRLRLAGRGARVSRAEPAACFDPLDPAERARLESSPRPRNSLPLFGGKRRHLPLADAVRPIDRSDRPIYVVWELTLRCDLACRHCGSRAGPARPDELGLPEALDLVRQLAALGVKEVTLIGGEVYLYEG